MNAAKLKLEARAWGEREQLKSIRKAFSEPKACPVIRRIAPRSQVDNDACDDGVEKEAAAMAALLAPRAQLGSRP